MSVSELWLPIILSGLATHILSTLAWTVLPHHKPEWRQLPSEEEFLDWVNRQGAVPGQYIFPFPKDGKEVNTEAFKLKQSKCNGTLILWKGPINMGQAIGLTLAFFMLAALMIAYVASIALPSGAAFTKVFQLVTTVGLLTHCAAKFPYVFWFPQKTAMELLDGIVFALTTGVIFSLLWPK